MNFRSDRLASLYLAAPVLRFARGEGAVPILMYHSISDEDESEIHPYFRTKTSPATFALQMKQLHDCGYQTCCVTEALQRLQTAKPSGKFVVLTFDDGYRDFYRHAFPLLQQYGFNATVFLPTAFIGEQPLSFKGTECLTWAEVRELHKHGVRFGSHTVTHPQLRQLSPIQIREELVHSREAIEEKLSCRVDSFAYPYAFPQVDAAFKEMFRNSLLVSGYQSAVCTIVGRAKRGSEPLCLERLPVNSCDDPALFQAKLDGAYDWIGTFQSLSKRAKTILRGSPPVRKQSINKDFPCSS